ncbi:hypothetical protein BGZ96_000304 [Linnemannia gamsii]|uniref:SAC domain-containing protein n=1 Tax=Linnemannia gamsii TaxID=64522 RepID=A0ABQ7JQI2_9FUNG|nr:hypothetical protein BGZ96_000304 [Linnemannia gamsii]
MVIYNSLRLYTNADTFTLEPVHNDPSVKSENIVIHRTTGELRFNGPTNRVTADEEVLTIYGVIGFIRLLAGEYMIVVTDRIKVGRMGEHDIFRLKDYKIMPFSRNYLALSEAQTNDETAFIALLHQHLQSSQFHFSYGYEITHTLQRQSEFRGDTQPIWERADERFFWNYRLQSKFIDHMRTHKNHDLSRFILPIMNGFAEFRTAEINKRTFTFALISRRSRHRAGTRFFSRGIDAHGNVSNFNETEHIVILDPVTNALIPSNRTVMAHVQTRGSIPIYWTQINNIKYTPKLQIFDNPDTEAAFRKHFDTQKRYYGPQLVINLVNKKGYETPMGAAFSKQIDILSDPQIKYHHFDFHQECIWADNADVVSCAYSGTGALKTDFTRTGSRTKVGALQDLQNSIVRYVKNNYLDGARQDAYDLFLGVFDLQEAGSAPIVEGQPLILKALPVVLLVCFAMLTTCAIVPEIPLAFDLPENHFPGISESKLDTGEIELGWKNE